MASFISRVIFALVAAAAIIGAALAWLHWTDQNNTLPLGRVLNADQVAQLPERDKADGPVVVRLGRNLLALVNPTRFPIHYTGYTIHSMDPKPRPGEINPLYDKQFRDAAGEWKSNVGGWCGTGAANLTIPPGHAGQFTVHTGVSLPPERRGEFERVGISYGKTLEPGKGAIVWSEPFRP